MAPVTAHIIESVTTDAMSGALLVVAIATAAFCLWLCGEHYFVKHGSFERDTSLWGPARHDRIGYAAAVSVMLVSASMIAPGSAASQDREVPVGLPDLVSDPPEIQFEKTVVGDDGSVILAIAFDGYLRNNGLGVLELLGNPQIPGDVKQRWWDGESWIEVATPRVQFETTDDHNHFHLMAAAEYELWDDARTTKVGDSSKVGFCLLDSLDRASTYDEFYGIDTVSYCEKDNPDATSLRMGITPGWVDLYDANTTLQWVDVSTTPPGWYWIGSIIDPEDQIVESDEDNNELVFSTTKFAVSGYSARPLPMQSAGEPIRLFADAVGDVGPLVWTVVDGPTNGRLDVPTGVDLTQGSVTYLPDPGFDGIDSFTVTAHDLTSAFPLEPVQAVIEVDASATTEFVEPTDAFPVVDQADLVAAELLPATIELREWERFELNVANDPAFDSTAFDITGLDDADSGNLDGLRWFAADLAPGLAIDPMSGVIRGVPTAAGPGTALLTAVWGDRARTVALDWVVLRPDNSERTLNALNDLSSPVQGLFTLNIGPTVGNASYAATGLPDGTRVTDNFPLLTGTPAETGSYDVEIEMSVDGELIETASFTWTIRPAAIPEFAL